MPWKERGDERLKNRDIERDRERERERDRERGREIVNPAFNNHYTNDCYCYTSIGLKSSNIVLYKCIHGNL